MISARAPHALAPIATRQLLAFGVTLLGSFATGLSGQLVTAALPDIQGALGVSADEASWLSSVYPMAQIAMVALAAPLSLALGVRRFLMMLTGLFLFSCVLAATARSLDGEIILRLLQGLSAGGYGTAAFAMTFRTFGGRDLRPGILGLAFATTFPAAIGILSASWLVDGIGWQAIYVFDAVLAGIVLFGVYRFMDPECFRPTLLQRLDWIGFALLTPGLGLLLLVLSQGDRRFWTESGWLGLALLASMTLLGAFVLVETHRKNPLVNLRLLVHPNFGVACFINLLFRITLLSPTVVVPRFLAELQNYRNPELVSVFWLPAALQLMVYPLVTLATHRVDPRGLIVMGFGLLASAMTIDASHTSASAAGEFAVSQVLAGLAAPLVIVPLLLLGVRGVRPEDGASAGVLWNAVLTLGSTGGAGILNYVIRMRSYHHSNHLNDFLTLAWAPLANRLDSLSTGLGAHIVDDAGAETAAASSVASAVHTQAVALALSDVFAILAIAAGIGLIATRLFPRWQDRKVAS